jgi:hypothetical protein
VNKIRSTMENGTLLPKKQRDSGTYEIHFGNKLKK